MGNYARLPHGFWERFLTVVNGFCVKRGSVSPCAKLHHSLGGSHVAAAHHAGPVRVLSHCECGLAGGQPWAPAQLQHGADTFTPPIPSMWIGPWQPKTLPLILYSLLSRDSRWNKKSERCHMGCDPRNPRPRCNVEPPGARRGVDALTYLFHSPVLSGVPTEHCRRGRGGARSAPRALTFYSIYCTRAGVLCP